jgi:hypothetical protein
MQAVTCKRWHASSGIMYGRAPMPVAAAAEHHTALQYICQQRALCATWGCYLGLLPAHPASQGVSAGPTTCPCFQPTRYFQANDLPLLPTHSTPTSFMTTTQHQCTSPTCVPLKLLQAAAPRQLCQPARHVGGRARLQQVLRPLAPHQPQQALVPAAGASQSVSGHCMLLALARLQLAL